MASFDRKRLGKKLSNREWGSTTDGDARIAKLKDGRTHLGNLAEHVVDLESGVIVSVGLYHGDECDTKTLGRSLEEPRAALGVLLGSDAPDAAAPAEVIGDKGYHSRAVLKELPDVFRSRISEPAHRGRLHWRGDAVYGNRGRLFGEGQGVAAGARGAGGAEFRALPRPGRDAAVMASWA